MLRVPAGVQRDGLQGEVGVGNLLPGQLMVIAMLVDHDRLALGHRDTYQHKPVPSADLAEVAGHSVHHPKAGRLLRQVLGAVCQQVPAADSVVLDVGAKLGTSDRLIKRYQMTKDLSDLIVFMVNGYIRPTDIRNMQHKHVEVIKREWTYLRLTLPPSKGHSFPITTMPWAVKVYERICRRQEVELGRPVEPTDYVFMAHAKSRDNALKSLARQFDIVLDITGLKVSNLGEPRSLYSLRHSSIMFRLMFGRTVDTLTLARNARTSPEMIDRFYAAPLQGEMNVGELQSKRRPRPWE